MTNISTAVRSVTRIKASPKSGAAPYSLDVSPCGSVDSAIGQTAGVSTRLIPVADWTKHHDWPPVGGLRHLIFFANTNGFCKAIKRVGRRVLIDEAAFFTWVENQQSQQRGEA